MPNPETKEVLLEIAEEFDRLATGELPNPPLGFQISGEHIESALRAVNSHIDKAEHRISQHGRLMQRLKDTGGDLAMAHHLQLNLETELQHMRKVRTRLLTELEHDRIPGAT